MTNSTYGPYSPTAWHDGTTPLNQTNLRNLETQASVGLYGLNPQLSGPFVLSGITCTKDGTTANQLDIASGYAFVTMSDGTTGFIVVGADNTHTTIAVSSTYHLYLQPDGTWYWSTSNSPAANSLAIASVTTDGSGNINVVTDVRALSSGNSLTTSRITCVVAETINRPWTVTTGPSTVMSYTPPVNGWYRVGASFNYVNGTPQKPILRLNWQDPTAGVYAYNYFRSAWDGQWLNGSQTSAMANNQLVATEPITFRAKAGALFAVEFQDPGGTPNDLVSAVLERLT